MLNFWIQNDSEHFGFFLMNSLDSVSLFKGLPQVEFSGQCVSVFASFSIQWQT